MEQDAIDYDMVIADLEAKRDAAIEAIEGIQKVRAIYGQGGMVNGTVPKGKFDPENLPTNHFHGMNIPQAAVYLLETVKKPMNSRDIAEALEQGGLRHTSKNFMNTVNTALYRLALGDDPTVIKVGREGWGLRSWYPGWRRPKGKGEDSETVTPEETEAPGLKLD